MEKTNEYLNGAGTQQVIDDHDLLVDVDEVVEDQLRDTLVDHEESVDSTTSQTDDASREVGATRSSTVAGRFTKVEKSLASLGFFTPSSRRIKDQKVKRIDFTRDVEGKRVEATADIVPSAMFGLPITADQDKYLALQQIITEKLQADGNIANPIRFKSADLLRLLNRSTKTGKNYKEISEWLDVMSSTTIISNGAVYVAGQKRFARDRFRVFDRAVSVGKEMEDGTVADANYIWLSAWQLENMNSHFVLPVDLEAYRELKNHISKALVPLLQVWLYASRRAGLFEKRYSELCEILALQTYRAPSHILRQLKPSLDELVQHGYLEKWRIEKTTDRKSYKVVFFHGAKFHRDLRRSPKKSDSAPIVIAESEPFEPQLPEPGKLPHADIEISSNVIEVAEPEGDSSTAEQLVDELATRGVIPSVALRLLNSLQSDRLENVRDYIDYWDHAKQRGDVGPGLLYELIRDGGALPADFETVRQRAKRVIEDRRRKDRATVEETLKSRYEDYRHDASDRLVAAVPADEFESRVAAHKAAMLAQPGFWSEHPEMAEQFSRHAIQFEITENAQVTPFEDFRRMELPRILAELGLNAAELGIELDQTVTPEPDTAPEAQNDAPLIVSPGNDGFSISDQNSSPGGS
jgi:hypothetical protein